MEKNPSPKKQSLKNQPPKEPSLEERKKIKQQRELFKEFHDVFKDDDLVSVQIDLTTFKSFLQASYDRYALKVDVKQLDVLEGTQDRLKYVLEMFQDLSVAEALLHLEQLEAAINYEKQQKELETKVSDLEIKLLS